MAVSRACTLSHIAWSYDYLLKPLRGVELLDGIDRCLAAAVEAHLKK